MTNASETKNSRERAQQVLDAYGADEARWPDADRDAVRQAIAADPALAKRQAEEAEMDALLALAPVEAPSYALQTRILSTHKDEGVSGVGIVKQLLDVLWPFGSAAIPAGALAASVLLGVASGGLTTAATESWSDDQSYDVLALALGDTALSDTGLTEEWQ
jgi:anti-sigma factor RsiW